MIDKAVAMYREPGDKYDYVSNSLTQSYPYGLAVEVFSGKVLQEAYLEAVAAPEREHVSPFIYTRPERFRIGQLVQYENLSYHRWTVDTPEDFELVRRIIEALYPHNPQFSTEDVLELLKEHPDWLQINAHVHQKKLGE